MPAVNRASFDKAYRDIGQALGVKGTDDDQTDVCVLVHAALARDDVGSWLWIVDNADDQELLFGEQGVPRLPFNRKGSILVTTRNHDVAIRLDIRSPSLWIVEAMYRPESTKLLCQGLSEDQIQDTTNTDALLDFLVDLPLAMKQASAYMAMRRITIARYLEYCKSSNETLIKLLSNDFGDQGRYEAAQNPIATTWLISFEHIARDVPLAAVYLRFMSFFSEKNIPRVLLPEDDDLEADVALGTLKSYAFVNERMDNGSFDIHRLVQLAMLNWLADKGELVAWLTRAIKRLDEVYPVPKYGNKETWMSYLPHTQNTLKTLAETTDKSRKSRLLHKAGASSYLLGQYTEAELMFRQALKLRTEVLGPEHLDTVSIMGRLASALESQGQYTEAVALHRKTLELRTEVLGIEDPETVSSIIHTANALTGLGQYTEAKIMLYEAFEFDIKLLGVEHPNTILSMSYIAFVLEKLGQYKEAQTMHRKALELNTKALGAEHPNTITSMSSLASTLEKLGQYSEAQTMCRKVFELYTKVLGAEHPGTIRSLSNIAVTLERLGQYAEAQTMHSKALGLYMKVMGAEHPDTLIIMNNLGVVLRKQGQYAEAEATHRKTLELSIKVLGTEHPTTLLNMDNLGLTLMRQGQDAEAEAMHRKTLELRSKILGTEHPNTLNSMSYLGLTLMRQGQYAEAEAIHRKTLELRTKVLGVEHPHTIASKRNIAALSNT